MYSDKYKKQLNSFFNDAEKAYLGNSLGLENLKRLTGLLDEILVTVKNLLRKNEAREVTVLVDDLTMFLSDFSNKSSGKHFEVKDKDKIHLVWDLDLCILKSVRVSDNEDPALHTVVIERFGGRSGKANLHVDDDLMRYKTYLRGWTRFVLFFLKPFCFHYVFTSASRGYMTNVVDLLEGLETDVGVTLFYETKLSATDFPQKHLSINGKSVRELEIAIIKNGGSFRFHKVLLVDDQYRYHFAQPFNGVRVKCMPILKYDLKDKTLLDLLLFITHRVLEDETTFYKSIFYSQPKEYWHRLSLHQLKQITSSKLVSILEKSKTNKWKFIKTNLLQFYETKFTECCQNDMLKIEFLAYIEKNLQPVKLLEYVASLT